MNGAVVTGADMGRFAGYVLQDDVLPGSSTVQEYLRLVHIPCLKSFDQPTSLLQDRRSCRYFICLRA